MSDTAVGELAPIVAESVNNWQVRIVLSGEIDGAVAPLLRAELARHLAAGRRVVRLDARRLDFIDTTALGVLLEMHWRCLRAGGTLLLSGVHDPLRRLLTITGLDAVLLVDRADAPGVGGTAARLPHQRIASLHY
jgi:anti-sigma B factor antagonist